MLASIAFIATRRWRARIRALLPLALVACAEVEVEPELAQRELAAASAEPSLLVAGIGDAENATFSAEGRLFVTGGEGAYEIVREGAGFAARRIYDGVCNFTGIAERGGYLYATCQEGPLLGGTPLLLAGAVMGEVQLQVIHRFQQVGIPNGIAFDARGRLLVADFTPLLGKIAVLRFDSGVPPRVAQEQVWHGMSHPLANGLKVFRDAVYLTDLSQIKRIPILEDGSAGRVSVLVTRVGTVFDDLHVDEQGISVADFYGGTLLSYSLTGRMRGQSPALFSAPSSITPARGPLLAPGTLVVTEKGELGELTSTNGNRVSLYAATGIE
jgi:hypothetical protein